MTGGMSCRAFVCDVAIECRTNMFRRGVGFEWRAEFGFPPVDHRGLSERGVLFGAFIFHSQSAVADVVVKWDWSEIPVVNF